MLYEIKHRITGAVLYACDGESLREVVEAAVEISVDLSYADLRGASLSYADLGGANLRCSDLSNADLSNVSLRGADLRGAKLVGADLRGADLRGADLYGADLRGANLSGAELVGNRPVLQIGPIGSRADYLAAYLTDAGVKIAAGCFFGSLEEFRAAVTKTHEGGLHGREYAAAIQMIEVHAELWAAKETNDER